MNLQQLEYIIAVDNHRHFARAAEHCFVTQPTLSMMIQKLEEELQVKIFDRSRQPVEPTKAGALILEQARRILNESRRLHEIVAELNEQTAGRLHIGIIPTLAPYLLPYFVKPLLEKHPELTLNIEEMTTQAIVSHLKNERIDAGILVTPLREHGIRETPLFTEKFYAYVSDNEQIYTKKFLLPEDLDINRLWILEEGHCFRTQVLNLCEIRRDFEVEGRFKIAAGSFETVMNLVDNYGGLTIVPELVALNMPPSAHPRLKSFSEPVPVRQVSLVTLDSFPRQKMAEVLCQEILQALPEVLKVRHETARTIHL
ncbi:MAG TPA: LysR substrate-binding domain-containing protein [Saprospiraceae bacterium]|nr:LysR substrate-binding domain-containing protein [Saprospiraceae bacterium]